VNAGTWKDATPSNPCPICCKGDWCRVSANGKRVCCRRLATHAAHGNGKEATDQSGGTFWSYYIGERVNPHPPTRSHTEGATNPATDDERDRVYRRLLNALPCPKVVAEFLDARGVPDNSPLRKRYRYHQLNPRAATVRKLLADGLESILARTPGFFVQEKDKASWWTLSGSPGIAIPVCDYKGRVVGVLIRPDSTSNGKYTWLSSSKRGGAKARAIPHVPFFEGDKSTVRLTEGAVKADIATALGGILTVGLPGLSAMRVAKTLRQVGAKTVRLSLDADAATNPAVARAVATHHKKLSREFEVQLERWDAKDGKGIDDLLANGKTPELVTGAAVAGAVADLERSAGAASCDGRPIVVVGTNEFEVVRDVVNALARHDGQLYQREGELAEVIQPAGECVANALPRIVPLKAANIRNRVTRFVDLRQQTKTAKQPSENPPTNPRTGSRARSRN
jgi:hypothetical protein